MRGVTNAKGIDGPDLTKTLAPLIRRVSQLENNPPVGSLTQFAGYDWVVVHWDNANARMYLMLKDISAKTTWADSAFGHTPYENSNVKAKLAAFNSLLERMIFGSQAVTAQRLEVSRLANTRLFRQKRSFSAFFFSVSRLSLMRETICFLITNAPPFAPKEYFKDGGFPAPERATTANAIMSVKTPGF